MEQGRVILVERYRPGNAKAVVLHPEDFEMLEQSHDLLEAAGQLSPREIGDVALEAQSIEDRPSPERAIEDPDELKALLGP